jgi:HSP20 family protein
MVIGQNHPFEIVTKDLELTVLGDTVMLKGERKDEAGEDERFYRKERPSGAFVRTVTLPAAIDPGSAKAEYRDGVLTVRMEKEERAKARRVEIAS